MEWLGYLLPEYGNLILSGGLLMVLLLQTITLHKIRKTAKLLKRMEAGIKWENEKVNAEVQLQAEMQQVKMKKTAGEAEVPKAALESQQLEETPEQLIDAVLAEVFR